MIRTRQDYRRYLQADRQASNRPKGTVVNRLFYSETYYVLHYLETLRKLEFLTNKRKNFLDQISYLIVLRRHKKWSLKLQLTIPPNVSGPGLSILHLGNIVVNAGARLGSGCMLQPGVVIGQKDGPENVPVIGNNVYFGPGCKVIGKVTVGSNVVIAPNSVVVKDVPDDCVVSGVPAKIIRQNGVKVS